MSHARSISFQLRTLIQRLMAVAWLALECHRKGVPVDTQTGNALEEVTSDQEVTLLRDLLSSLQRLSSTRQNVESLSPEGASEAEWAAFDLQELARWCTDLENEREQLLRENASLRDEARARFEWWRSLEAIEQELDKADVGRWIDGIPVGAAERVRGLAERFELLALADRSAFESLALYLGLDSQDPSIAWDQLLTEVAWLKEDHARLVDVVGPGLVVGITAKGAA